MSGVALRVFESGFNITSPRYAVRWRRGEACELSIEVEGLLMLRAGIAGSLDRMGEIEELTGIAVESPALDGNVVRLTVSSNSNLWSERRFEWRFFEDRIEHWHEAWGRGRLDVCRYLGLGESSPGDNTWVKAESMWSPQPNMAGRTVRSSWEPNAVHATNDTDHRAVSPLFHEFAFCPGPLFLAFLRQREARCLGAGLGAEAGSANYNGLLWSGDKHRGRGYFSLEYYGYQSVDGHWRTPRLVLHPGDEPHAAMRSHVAWLDQEGLSTSLRQPVADWHRKPLFCGWMEQANLARKHGDSPRPYATQANYEAWVQCLEDLDLPVGTLVIDDKWMKHYGVWDIDPDAWPDMPGFIERQHRAGRRVLLWVPCWHREGIRESWCVRDEKGPCQADPSNAEYLAFMAERARDLVDGIGADGLKMDWIFCLEKRPDYQMREPLWGIERLLRFQRTIYSAVHDARPDALVETQTPNPLFRDCSDMIRLNDLTSGLRGATRIMRERARVARIAGWELVDCDNASSSGLEEWREYMAAQASIGVPSLYCLTEMGSTSERITDGDWAFLREIWNGYLARELG